MYIGHNEFLLWEISDWLFPVLLCNFTLILFLLICSKTEIFKYKLSTWKKDLRKTPSKTYISIPHPAAHFPPSLQLYFMINTEGRLCDVISRPSCHIGLHSRDAMRWDFSTALKHPEIVPLLVFGGRSALPFLPRCQKFSSLFSLFVDLVYFNVLKNVLRL